MRAKLLDPEFNYTQSVNTNVLLTFRRFGWIPPSEQQEYIDKWAKYQTKKPPNLIGEITT